jgi:hypothetical protein
MGAGVMPQCARANIGILRMLFGCAFKSRL